MTNQPKDTKDMSELLPVTQADRDAVSKHARNKMNFGETLEEAFARHRLSTEAAIVAWQPIETAPRDGTKILAYGDALPMYFACLTWEGDGWAICVQGDAFRDWDGAPTHWMPLPAPPADAIEQGKHHV